MNSQPKFSITKSLLIVIAALVLFIAGCTKDSVVSNSPATPAAGSTPASTDMASATQQATPVTGASPTPTGPTGQTTPNSPFEPQPGETKVMQGNIPMVLSPAKPMLTPAPDPFPPRPTPPVIMENGKIKQQWQAAAEAASLTSPVKDRPDAAAQGKAYYLQKCADCHGKEGKGNGWMSAMTKRDGKVAVPPTNLASKAVQANSDGELFWKITNGKSPMPAHRIRFDDEQRWLIVAYLRTFKP